MRIGSEDMPALHDAASSASLWAQKTYLSLMRANLALLLCGATISAIHIDSSDLSRWVSGVGVAMLIGGLAITAMISQKNYDRVWYGGRAMAESIKTLAWRYMTCAEPFETGLSSKEVDARFATQLQAVLDQSEQLGVRLSGAGNRDQISESMRKVRAAGYTERLSTYVRDRVEDQRRWYTKKSSASADRERVLFRWIMGSQLLAIGAGLYASIVPSTRINWSGVFATLAAVVLAWLQVKRHQELAQSYAVAAHELSLIAIQSEHVASEDEVAAFVSDAETAISREHTLWVARRDVPNQRRKF
jgi:hypothetical protein